MPPDGLGRRLSSERLQLSHGPLDVVRVVALAESERCFIGTTELAPGRFSTSPVARDRMPERAGKELRREPVGRSRSAAPDGKLADRVRRLAIERKRERRVRQRGDVLLAAREPRGFGKRSRAGSELRRLVRSVCDRLRFRERRGRRRVAATGAHEPDRAQSHTPRDRRGAWMTQHERGGVGRRIPPTSSEIDPRTATEEVEAPRVEPVLGAELEALLQVPLGLVQREEPRRPEHEGGIGTAGVVVEPMLAGQRERLFEPGPSRLQSQLKLGRADVRERIRRHLDISQRAAQLERRVGKLQRFVVPFGSHASLGQVAVRERELTTGLERPEQLESLAGEWLPLRGPAKEEEQPGE